jgi:hypothetical protein
MTTSTSGDSRWRMCEGVGRDRSIESSLWLVGFGALAWRFHTSVDAMA